MAKTEEMALLYESHLHTQIKNNLLHNKNNFIYSNYEDAGMKNCMKHFWLVGNIFVSRQNQLKIIQIGEVQTLLEIGQF